MRTIILDFDGTLGDTRSVIVQTMQQTLATLSLPPRTDAECAATIGLPLAGGFAQLFPDAGPELGERAAQTYRDHFRRNMSAVQVPLFPHVTETLHQLQALGCTLAIASSRSRASLLHFVHDMHLDEVIRCVVGADDVEHHKPDPEPVFKVLQWLQADGVLPSPEAGQGDLWVVGDMTFDILMGRRAGARTVGVTYGNGTRAELAEAGADYIVDDFRSLLHILETTDVDDDVLPLPEGHFVRSH